jgi:hypothetical protein
MEPMEFREIEIGDTFRLDRRLYRKHSKYSAVLLRQASDREPMIQLKRMIHPDVNVEQAELGVM